MIYITSDHHFGHANILDYCPNRHFDTIEEHDEALIAAWNNRVKRNDIVVHLGDFGFYPAHCNKILKRLHGKKILITGNHDKHVLHDTDFKSQFSRIIDTYFEWKVAYHGREIDLILCHYPLETWNKAYHGAFHLHGHCHSPPEKSKVRRVKNRREIGVDTRHDHAPWELDEIVNLMIESDKRFVTKG